MIYVGCKKKIANDFLPLIIKNREADQWYVEPFVGGFNVIDKINGNRIANDTNYYLIELFRAIQNGWIPPLQISEEEYNDIKNNKEKYPPYLVGFVGFNCSFSSQFFGVYARGKDRRHKDVNFCYRGRNAILKQAEFIKEIILENKNYYDLKIPPKSIIYCDPPYRNTRNKKAYGCSVKFDSDRFWQWARDKTKEGHRVFVSEYNAPDDFECIWQKEVKVNIRPSSTGRKMEIEKLFVFKE
jgi:DNA adenine methylase